MPEFYCNSGTHLAAVDSTQQSSQLVLDFFFLSPTYSPGLLYTVGTESIQTPLNFSLFVSLQPFAKIKKVHFISH